MITIIELDKSAFSSDFVCLGEQFSKIVQCINQIAPSLRWYCGDVRSWSTVEEWKTGNLLQHIGSAAEMLQLAEPVVQFMSGVFIGVDCVVQNLDSPCYVDTENLTVIPLSNRFVQIHCFDTSMFWIATNDPGVLAELRCFRPSGKVIPG